MPRNTATWILGLVLLGGCTFEAGGDGYIFKLPAEDTGVVEDTPRATPDLGDASYDFFACILTISTQGGTIQGCMNAAPEEIVPYLDSLQTCQQQHCNDLKFDPESESFMPVAFRNCLKSACPEYLVACFAHAENSEGCQRYVICGDQCADTGVACDLGCMKKLSPDDVPSTVEYIHCMEELVQIPEGGGIMEKFCECLGICHVPHPACDED